MKILVTGGAGFIGSCFVRHILTKYPDYKITNLDLLTYCGDINNLNDVLPNDNHHFVHGDIRDEQLVKELMKNVDVCINFAAESHVDRSIVDPNVFINTNVLGTHILLNQAKQNNISLFIQISTDEVYGSLPAEGYFTEKTPIAPNSPYSASKASADLIVRSFFKTYGFPVIVTRCTNNYGPYQYPEKLIPLFISNLLKNIQVPVYGDGLNIRDWLYVYDHCEAIDLAMHKGTPGEVYNIGGNNEITNIELTKLILKELNKSENLIKYVEDRLGHDRRYAIDSSKIQKELGWRPNTSFETGMKKTINWYLDNLEWLENKEKCLMKR